MGFYARLEVWMELGNTLDAVTKEQNPTPDEHESAWGNPVTTKAMIDFVKDAGFDILRLPISWCRQIDEQHRINGAWMDRVNELVDLGINDGLKVIINLHHEDWHFPSEENYPKAAERMKAVWAQIAERFKDYGNGLIFEVMNEPRKYKTPVEWNGGDEEGRSVVMKLNRAAWDAIRAAGGKNAERMIMLPTYAANSDDAGMSDFSVPDDKNIIVSLHAYTPYRFALSDEPVNTWSASNAEDTKDIDALFARMEKYFLSKRVPVILGECGARNKGENTAARAEWARYTAQKAREYSVPAIWWDNGSFEGDGECFGLMDRNNVAWKYPQVADAFLLK